VKVLIVGCGRVGATLAGQLDREGHQVTILDLDSYAFRRLPSGFGGTALVGNGIDQDVLVRAGIQDSDVFVAATQGDNRNAMSAQIAQKIFNVPRVVTRIYDPIRERMYQELGLETYSPTMVGAANMYNLVTGAAREGADQSVV
jgi:trk system potassium uptake protein TrkA